MVVFTLARAREVRVFSLAIRPCHSALNVGRQLAATSFAVLVGLAAQGLMFSPALAEDGLSIELNKLESQDQGCRAYFVIDNKNSTTYETLKLDFVVFGRDGVISQRFAVDLAPLNANKRTVKLFDIPDTACDQMGSILINEVMGCKVDSREDANCLQEISVSSRTDVQLVK
jgi:hypothetical protein